MSSDFDRGSRTSQTGKNTSLKDSNSTTVVFASHGTLLALRPRSSHSLIAGVAAVHHIVIGLATVLAVYFRNRVSAAASDA